MCGAICIHSVCTLYYMLTGMAPFPEGTVLQKLLSHSSEDPPDPRDLRGDVPPELATVCLKLMAKQPSQRYQQPRELIAELTSLCEALGYIAPTPTTLSAERSEWFERIAPHIPWAVPLVMLFGIVFGVESLLPDAEPVSTRATCSQLEAPRGGGVGCPKRAAGCSGEGSADRRAAAF